MIKVTNRHMNDTHFNSAYSQMPAVALQMQKPSNWSATFFRNRILMTFDHVRDTRRFLVLRT